MEHSQQSQSSFQPKETEEDYGFVMSLQFQFLVAMMVLLASFVPTILANYHRAREVDGEADLEPPSKRQSKKKRKGGNGNNSPAGKNEKDLNGTTGDVDTVNHTTQEALRAAAATRRAAHQDAETTRQRAKEDVEAMMKDAQETAAAEAKEKAELEKGALRKMAEEEFATLKKQAELETEALRKKAEDELVALKKQVAEETEMMMQQKAQEEAIMKRVQKAAEEAKQQMAKELEVLKLEARREVEVLQTQAMEEAARIRKEALDEKANWRSGKSWGPPKPPKLQTSREASTGGQIAARGDRAVTPPTGSPHASRSQEGSPHGSPRSSTSPGGCSNVATGPGVLFGGPDHFTHFPEKWSGSWPPSGGGFRSSSAPTTRAASPQGDALSASPKNLSPQGPTASPMVPESFPDFQPPMLPGPEVPTTASVSAKDNVEQRDFGVPLAPDAAAGGFVGSMPPRMQYQPGAYPMHQAAPQQAAQQWYTVQGGQGSAQGGNQNRPSEGGCPDPKQLVPYKLKLCHKFMNSGMCKRGSQCTYAHGEEEIGMERPIELQAVTLGEMNARRRGKNMVTVSPPEDSQLDQQQQQHHQHHQHQQHQPHHHHHHHHHFSPEQQMAMGYWPSSEVVPGAGIASDEASSQHTLGSHIAVPTSDGDVTTVEATWASGPTDLAAVHQSEGWATVAAKPKAPSPKSLKVEIPPKLPKGGGGDNPSKVGAAKKEPSPFLPLSPAMDQAEASWADEPTPDGLEPLDQGTFSWADQASTDFKASLARSQRISCFCLSCLLSVLEWLGGEVYTDCGGAGMFVESSR